MGDETKPPHGLGKAGHKLWHHVASNYDLMGNEPVLEELCRVADRLAEVRSRIAEDGLVDGNGRKHALADLEPKLSGQFRMLWRLLGLSDDEEPKPPWEGR